MSNFVSWVSFSKFQGTVPTDKEEQLYDFYMLSFLRGRSGYEARRPEFRDKTGYDISQFSVVRPDPGEMDHDDRLDHMLGEVADTLLPNLKKNLLEAVFFSLSAEIRHVFDRNSSGKLIDMIFKSLGERIARGFRNYAKQLALFKDKTTVDLVRKPSVSHPDIRPSLKKEPPTWSNPSITGGNDPQHNEYATSYFAVLKSGLERPDFVYLMKFLYENASWASSYGGKAWAGICNGWQKLYSATKDPELSVWIDHIYDLQHNTGTVFNKVKAYAKDGHYDWLSKALDHKASIKEPHEIIDKISSSFRPLAYRAIKAKTGRTLEDYMKEKNKPAVVQQKTFTPLAPYPDEDEVELDKQDETQKKEVGKRMMEIFQRVDGGDVLKAARTLFLHKSYTHNSLINTPEKMLDFLVELNPVLSGHEDKVLSFYSYESKQEESIGNSDLIHLGFGTMNTMSPSQLTDVLNKYAHFAVNLSEQTKAEMGDKFMAQDNIGAIKIFKDRTNYSLLASKAYTQFLYANWVAKGGKPQQQTDNLPLVTKYNAFDGNSELRLARLINSLQNMATPQDIEHYVKLLGLTKKPSISTVMYWITREKNTFNLYTDAKISGVLPKNKEEALQITKILGAFDVALTPQKMQELNNVMGDVNAVAVLKKALGWSLAACRKVYAHFFAAKIVNNPNYF